ncbi:hypothetical protein [Calothrix sp. 336/3]|uniref:hypothetical protein n=1 Tax=Calothrix sp. 336/3 TaxID=1337936 RepID=UPI00143CB094|nr:hypothetical protein [Calothrix sp. 336/3]
MSNRLYDLAIELHSASAIELHSASAIELHSASAIANLHANEPIPYIEFYFYC